MGVGRTVEEALVHAATVTGTGGLNDWKDGTKLSKMKVLLRNPDFAEAVRDVYQVAGFTLEDAAAAHLAHIRGENVDGDGKPIPPNYGALRDYLKAVLPAQPSRVRVQSEVLVRRLQDREGPPPIAARAIGEVRES